MCAIYKKSWKKSPAKIAAMVFMGIAFFLALGWVVMLLWNFILPDVVGIGSLNYLQALGLLLLSKILFGGFGSRNWKRKPNHFQSRKDYWKEKWKHMSEEERAKMKEGWKNKKC